MPIVSRYSIAPRTAGEIGLAGADPPGAEDVGTGGGKISLARIPMIV